MMVRFHWPQSTMLLTDLQHAFPAKIYRVTSTLDKVIVILHPKKSIKLTWSGCLWRKATRSTLQIRIRPKPCYNLAKMNE